jgi:hypothetical protein
MQCPSIRASSSPRIGNSSTHLENRPCQRPLRDLARVLASPLPLGGAPPRSAFELEFGATRYPRSPSLGFLETPESTGGTPRSARGVSGLGLGPGYCGSKSGPEKAPGETPPKRTPVTGDRRVAETVETAETAAVRVRGGEDRDANRDGKCILGDVSHRT